MLGKPVTNMSDYYNFSGVTADGGDFFPTSISLTTFKETQPPISSHSTSQEAQSPTSQNSHQRDLLASIRFPSLEEPESEHRRTL